MRDSEKLIKLTDKLAKNSGIKDRLTFSIIIVTIYKNLDLSQINEMIQGWLKQEVSNQKDLLETILKDFEQTKICPNLKIKLEQIILA
jgi:hypothetical protein